MAARTDRRSRYPGRGAAERPCSARRTRGRYPDPVTTRTPVAEAPGAPSPSPSRWPRPTLAAGSACRGARGLERARPGQRAARSCGLRVRAAGGHRADRRAVAARRGGPLGRSEVRSGRLRHRGRRGPRRAAAPPRSPSRARVPPTRLRRRLRRAPPGPGRPWPARRVPAPCRRVPRGRSAWRRGWPWSPRATASTRASVSGETSGIGNMYSRPSRRAGSPSPPRSCRPSSRYFSR